jgi:hypothetical protein
MDIREVQVSKVGSNLKIDMEMEEVTRIWLPPNQFDHVLINIYIDLPGRDGVRDLPFQHAAMPGESAWDFLVSVAGFGSAIFSAEGAGANHTGLATGPAASISSEADSHTITFCIASEALGYPEELEGSKIYITTWDGGPGSPRALGPELQLWSFSGGNATDARIMDDTELIIIKK